MRQLWYHLLNPRSRLMKFQYAVIACASTRYHVQKAADSNFGTDGSSFSFFV